MLQLNKQSAFEVKITADKANMAQQTKEPTKNQDNADYQLSDKERNKLSSKGAVAYYGDGEHRFRFYREHLNSTHWVHDIFNLSVHDGQF